MFELWQQFRTITNELDSSIDFRSLSPQHKANIVPYMLNKIDNDLLVKIMIKIKERPVFNGDEGFVGNGFVVKDECAFFINPFDQFNIQSAYERTHSDKVPKFKKIGIIAARHPIFKTQKKQDLKITSEHSSEKFFNKLIIIANHQGASDIHISPRNKTHVYFRFRIDGLLIDNLVDDLDVESYKLVANQIITNAGGEGGNFVKILAEKFNFSKKDVDVATRVSMIPTEFLFKNKTIVPRFVMRFHDNLSDVKMLDAIGLNAYTFKNIFDITRKNQGLVVVTGPTGSGKTTLLYALLDAIKSSQRGKSIQTVEDPVEKILPGIDQCSINEDADVTHESVLKAFLRQDVDVALVGETRDEITAQKTTEIAMTGHLALTTLHTNISLGTINRLRRLGVDDRDTADVLKTVIAARLVRKVCPHCAKKIKANQETLGKYERLFLKVSKEIKIKNTGLLIAGEGCVKCKFKAYQDRVLVAEIFNIDTKAQTMIVNKDSISKIEEHLVKNGGQTIWSHAIEHLLRGNTTLRELEYVLPPFVGNI